jgi:WD40 repeat protein
MPGVGLAGFLEGHTHDANCLAFNSKANILLSGGGDGKLNFWRFPEGQLLESREAHNGAVTHLALTADGLLAATASSDGVGQDHTVRIWTVADRLLARTLYGHQGIINCMALSPDGLVLASGSRDGSVRTWASPLARLADLPPAKATLSDLELAQAASRTANANDNEHQAWAFIAALFERYRRYDVMVEEASPRKMELGEFDIEIEERTP